MYTNILLEYFGIGINASEVCKAYLEIIRSNITAPESASSVRKEWFCNSIIFAQKTVQVQMRLENIACELTAQNS